MKKRKWLAVFAAVLFALSMLSGTALAAEADGEETTPPPIMLYPAEVNMSEGNGTVRMEKVYYLSARDDPANIPTEDFQREGLYYTLLDILKNDLSETDTKDFIETVTLESDTKDMAEIIQMLEPELEIVTEDGYTGILRPDYTSITVEAAGYNTSSWTVTASRTYPSLSDADVSLIPKSIEDNGRTLTLANVDWQEGNTDYVDGEPLAVLYTAVANYTGTATGRYATGYTVTVDYGGEVTKTSCDTIIYTAVFSAKNASQIETRFDIEETTAPTERAGETEPSAAPAAAGGAEGQSAGGGNIVLILGAVLLAALLGFGAWQLVKRYKKKRGEYIK